MTEDELQEIETVWRCRGGSYPMPEEAVTEAIDKLFADHRTLRRQRAKHLVLLLAFVDIVEALGTSGYGADSEKIYKRSVALVDLCQKELAEGRQKSLERELSTVDDLLSEIDQINLAVDCNVLHDYQQGEGW